MAACRIDWLHAVDLGIGADWIGQVMVSMLPLFPGAFQTARINALWMKVQVVYEVSPPRRPGSTTSRATCWA